MIKKTTKAKVIPMPSPKSRPQISMHPPARPLPGWRVRQMIPGEKFSFKTGIEYMTLDPRWVWVLCHNGQSRAVCAGADAHKLFIFLRIVAAPNVKSSGVLLLLRQALRDAKSRGCFGYTVYLMPELPTETKLLRIALRSGAGCLETSGVWIYGDLSKAKGLGHEPQRLGRQGLQGKPGKR